MSKTVLTLEEINLLKYSEEIRNTQIYGNLYEVLLQIKEVRAISLDELEVLHLNQYGKAAVTYNKRTLINNMTKEWRATTDIIDNSVRSARCQLCNAPNLRYECHIRNIKNNMDLLVGSECVKKFAIEGHQDLNKRMDEIKKGQKIAERRNEFMNAFPNCEEIISDAEIYFKNLPILIRFDLYTKLEETVKNLKLIFNSYVEEGKNPYSRELNSLELFEKMISEYNQLKIKTDEHITQYENNSLVCKRPEVNWLIENEKMDLLQRIAENNGLYTYNTLSCMSSRDYISRNLRIILEKNRSNFFEFKRFNGNNMVFAFNKQGYQSTITFSVTISDFMNTIGANCIIDKNYSFSSEEIIEIGKIIPSIQNIESLILFSNRIIDKLNYAFLLDYETEELWLCRKSDRAVRKFSIPGFLDNYSKTILLPNDSIRKNLFKWIDGRRAVKWHTPEMQAKVGTDDKINKLYKEYKEIYVGDKYYSHEKILEITAYNIAYNSINNATYIDFDNPEYITLQRNKIRLNNYQLGLVDYVIQISDDKLEPYKKGDLLLIQSTKNVRDKNIFFFLSEGKFNIKECHTEKKNENIFQYFKIKKNDTQAYGRIVYCYKK